MTHTPQTHHLKTVPELWDRQAAGLKNFEVRYNDREFRTGDILNLYRSVVGTAVNDGKLTRRVTYILPGGMEFGGRVLVDSAAVIMSTAPLSRPSSPVSLEAMQVEYLTGVLKDVRAQLCVVGNEATAAIIARITEALDEAPAT